MNKDCNVLVVYLGKKGGLPQFTYQVADGYARAGYNVYCILSEQIYNREEWESNSEFKHITYIYTGNTKKFLLTCMKMPTRNRSKISKELGGIDFDYSICTMPYPWCKYLSNVLDVKTKMVISHDPVAHSGSNRFLNLITYLSTVGYDRAIVMTRKFIPLLVEKYSYDENKVCYMRHGSYGYKETSGLEIDSQKPINFLFFGRISEYKGLNILLDAFKIVQEKGYTSKLTIAGGGDIKPYVEKITKLDNVNLMNRYIDDSEIPMIFSEANTVLVLPYINATQSGVIPVAMQYGVPIIASKTGGLVEQLFDGNLGLFFDSGNADDLAVILAKFISDRNLIVGESKKIRQYYKLLDWKVIITDFMESL